jgi:hypothetical protein
MSDFWTDIERKARKAHRCYECNRTIQPGETYTRSAGVWEGNFQCVKRCAHCMAYMRIIDRMDRGALEDWNLSDWVDEYGRSAAEIVYSKWPQPLMWLRWATWFSHRWTDAHGTLRELPELPA